MEDSRLNSVHLEFPRRQEFRRARDLLLQERGWLTLAGEKAHHVMGDGEDWPSLAPLKPAQLGTCGKFLLVDQATHSVHALHLGVNSLGRFTNNDVVFADGWISRRHCVILVHARGNCELHDTASRNGTFVNGIRIQQPVCLLSGDMIDLCKRRLLFVAEQDCHSGGEQHDHPDTIVE